MRKTSVKVMCNRKPWTKCQTPYISVLYSTALDICSHTVKPTLNNIRVGLTHICQHLHYKLLLNFYLVWFSTSICCTYPTLPTQAHLLHLTGTISFFNHLPSYLVKTFESVHTTADLILLFPLPLGPRALPFLPGLAAFSKATEPASANTEKLNQWLFSSYPMQFKVL